MRERGEIQDDFLDSSLGDKQAAIIFFTSDRKPISNCLKRNETKILEVIVTSDTKVRMKWP